jgi:hypothetical protein
MKERRLTTDGSSMAIETAHRASLSLKFKHPERQPKTPTAFSTFVRVDGSQTRSAAKAARSSASSALRCASSSPRRQIQIEKTECENFEPTI